jgi:MarR family transcriptional regulator, organic hydroperoxide resistance regulator
LYHQSAIGQEKCCTLAVCGLKPLTGGQKLPREAKAKKLEERQERRPKRPLDTSIGFLVRDLGRAVGKALGERIEPHGISVTQWLLLRCIAEDEGLSQRELSIRLGVMEPSSLELLLKLEEQGLVRRSRSTTDRRRVEIRLSAKGRRLFEAMWKYAEEVNDLVNSFGSAEEVRLLKELLHRVRELFP